MRNYFVFYFAAVTIKMYAMDASIDIFGDQKNYLSLLPIPIQARVKKYALSNSNLIPLMVKYSNVSLPEPVSTPMNLRSALKGTLSQNKTIEHTLDSTNHILHITYTSANKSWQIPWAIDGGTQFLFEYRAGPGVLKIVNSRITRFYKCHHDQNCELLYETEKAASMNPDGTKIVEINNDGPVIIHLANKAAIKIMKLCITPKTTDGANIPVSYRAPLNFNDGEQISAGYMIKKKVRKEDLPYNTDNFHISPATINYHATWDITKLINYEQQLRSLSDDVLLSLMYIHAYIKKDPALVSDADLARFVEYTGVEKKKSIANIFKRIRNSYLQ